MASIKKREFGRAVGQQRSRGFMLAVGMAGLLLAAVTFYVGYEAAYSVPGRGYYNIKAEFEDANNLANHYEVRVGGVRAGQVLDPHVENGKAVVDLRLDEKFKPLKSDSKLQVRLRSAVGVRYLEIRPGTSGTPLEEGDTLGTENVVKSEALDEILGTFDKQTRTRTSTLLRELGNGVNERGTDVNEILGKTPDFLTDLKGVSNAVTGRPNQQLSGFIRNGSRTAAAFDNAKNDIVAGFEPQRKALKIFTDAKPGVQGTLDTAPGALSSVRQNLPNVNRLVSEAGTLARTTRPTFRAAPSALKATTALLDDAQKPLDNLKETLGVADRSVTPILGLLDRVRPVLPTVDGFVDGVMPQATELAPKSCEISNVLRSWAHYLAIGDSDTNFIRFHLLAARPEQTAGGGKGPLNPIYDKFVNSTPYYGPCTNGNSEGMTGLQGPSTAQLINTGSKPFNNTDNKPYQTDPNFVSSPSQVIQGGK